MAESRFLLDTNILLDVFLNRQPWVVDAKALWQAHEDGRLTGYITATSLTNIFYIARKHVNLEAARDAVRTCLETFEICAVDRAVLESAAVLAGNDFEDNVQLMCASVASLDAVVTRDPADFKHANLPILAPAAALTRLSGLP